MNGAAAEKPTAAPAAAPPAAATGVKLPAGVASGQPTQGSIKFGSIGPAELQQKGTQPAPAAAAPAAPATAKPAAAAPPAAAPQPSKPVSFAAAASGGTAPKQQHTPAAGQQQQQLQHQHQQQQHQRGPGGGRAPRAQQSVTASMPQGPGFTSQPMATAFLLSPGAPVAYPQAYMLYNPSVSTQQYFAGGFGQAGQYPGFNYGTPPQSGNMPTGPRGPQPVPSMPVPPPPPQVSGGGASGGAAAHGSYGNAPSSPLPARTGNAATPPPARVRKILRIENPETHEVLNLADIAASKKPEASSGESAAAPAHKDESAVDEKVSRIIS